MNFQKLLEEEIEKIKNKDNKPKLLLHACCGPCSSYVIEYLSNYFDITIYYYNPNTYPEAEFDRRLEELNKFINGFNNNVKVIEEKYNPVEFYNVIKGLEHLGEKSRRCYNCYKLRMHRAALYAKDNNFDYFTTTLSISPYKNASWINEIGEKLEKKLGIKYLYSDFKKNNGYKRSLELSKEYNLYRQEYCGCVYSKQEKRKIVSLFILLCYNIVGDSMSQFERLELLVHEKMYDIYNKTVLILGLGGVGSYAVEALVRSGISSLIIVDNDTISLTNLNRQLIAYHSNIGNFKTDEIEKRILSINPNAKIQKVTEFIDMNNINNLFENNIDYVVDACDTLMVKFELIRICKKKNIKLISSMGTGNKMDPSRLKIMDIRKTSYDPLAKKIRKMVKDEKINGKVMVVCSDEQANVKIEKEIPSNSFVPATAGLLCASYIINDIVGDINV